MNEADKQLIIGALDSMGVALASHDHQWTTGERTIYEEALRALGVPPPESTPNHSQIGRT